MQRVVFTRGDGEHDTTPGAVLRYVERFGRGCVASAASSDPETCAGIQRVFFVASGTGTLTTSVGAYPVRAGDGVLVPAGVEHAFRSTGATPLELLIVEEALAGPPARSLLVRNYDGLPTRIGHGHYHACRLFGREDGLTQIGAVLVVRVEPMTAGEMHGHGIDTDEVWYMWKGTGAHVVDGEVHVQTPGTAIQVAPSQPGHSLVNHMATPLHAFYFAHRA